MNETKNKRLLSLDALRGFDMFFIMGGGGVIASLAVLFPCGFTEMLATQMDHVAWNGFAWFDIIFPLFLFIAGISFPFSYGSKLARGESRGRIYGGIVRRMLILVALGLVYNGILAFHFEDFRYYNVLARIGIAWAIAAVIFMNVRLRGRLVIAAVILLGYWALLALCPAPDSPGADPYSLEGNIVGYVDRMLLPGHLYLGVFDPEGILSTIPAIATEMLGMMAGELVKKDRDTAAEAAPTVADPHIAGGARTALRLAVIGVGLVIVGILWNLLFPINKNLWSSSFVCFVGGLSFLLFALFYYVIDVRGWKRWTFFFTVVGMNSITIYIGQQVINFGYTARYLGNGIASLLPECVEPLFSSLVYLLVSWFALWFLYRKKVFLKV